MINMYIYSSLSLINSIIIMIYSNMFKLLNINLMIEWNFMFLNSNNLSYSMFLDWMSLIFISTILFISSMIMLYSTSYMNNKYSINQFMWLVILFISSMIMMILSPNILSIILGWDMLGLISFCLIMFFQNYSSYNASMITILMNRIGDITLILSIIIMSNFNSWNLMMSLIYNNNLFIITILLMFCFLTKSAQFPFSSWLPKAMAAPTPISALVHSSTLVTAGIYMMMRFNFIITTKISMMILITATLTMFMSGLNAIHENDFKKIIALSTLSQLSFMFIILVIKFNKLMLFHLLTHAIFKSLLFMCAGVIIHNMNNNQDIRSYMNMPKNMPYINFIYSMSTFSLCGLIFMSGFYSKDLIIETLYMNSYNYIIMILILIATMFTCIYSLRTMLMLNFYSPQKNSPLNMTHFNFKMDMSMILSFIKTITFGAILQWMFFNNENIIIMPKHLKLMISFIILLSLPMIILYKKYPNYNMNNLMIFNMWYLDMIIKKIYYPLMMPNMYMNMHMEKGWFHMMSMSTMKKFIIMFTSMKMKKLFMTIPSMILIYMIIMIKYL